MARNLTRNTKLYVSNADVLDSNGVPLLGSVNNTNTWEIKVLDGYNFSQATSTEDISINEAGTTPIRGQKTYNTAQDPVDVSVTTYIRPYDDFTNSVVDAPEKILWASLAGSLASGAAVDANGNFSSAVTGSAILQRDVGTQTTADGMLIDFEESDSNELAKLTFWFQLEKSTYRVDNVNISTAEISFAIEDIAQIAWSGKGTKVTELSSADHTTIGAWVAGTAYTPTPATTANSFLRNKLSTMTLSNNNISTTTLAVGTVTSATVNSITEIGSTFVTDGIIAIGDYIRDSTTGETRVIDSFTETTITIVGNWDTTPSGSDSWAVYASNDAAGQNYTIAITGGSLTIENNMNFLTPAELGVVNQPLSGFAGSRKVSGSITAYLDTGVYGTAALLNDILEDINSVSNSYNFVLSIGGGSNAKRVDLTLGTAQLAVPTINIEAVIATEITFSGQGSADAIENQDELTVIYQTN